MQRQQNSKDIARQAADWAAIVELRSLAPEEATSLQHWLDADSRHLGAYGRARAALARCERIAALGSDHSSYRAVIKEPDPRSWMPSRRRFIGGAAAGAGACAAVAAGLALWPGKEPFKSMGTARGEISMVPLGEGSVATLNTGTRIALAFSGTERRVHLIGGEVFFDVASGEARPFIVQAGGYRARSSGSSFSFRFESQLAEILVADGMLDVARPSPDPRFARLRLGANMKLVDRYDRLSPPVGVTAEEIARELAWREGQIAFDERTLLEAAAEYRRYSATVLMPDPDVAGLRISGLFSTANPVGFADAAADVLGIRARKMAWGIRLSRA